jgi:hypothetical protein
MRNGHFYSRVTLLQDTDAARAAPAPIYEGVSAHPGLAVYALLLLANRDREEVVLYILCCNRACNSCNRAATEHATAATELMLQQSICSSCNRAIATARRLYCTHVSSYYLMCPHTTLHLYMYTCVLMLLYALLSLRIATASRLTGICCRLVRGCQMRLLLYICPHTYIYVRIR